MIQLKYLLRFKKCKEVGMTYNNLDDTEIQIPKELFEARQRELDQISPPATQCRWGSCSQCPICYWIILQGSDPIPLSRKWTSRQGIHCQPQNISSMLKRRSSWKPPRVPPPSWRMKSPNSSWTTSPRRVSWWWEVSTTSRPWSLTTPRLVTQCSMPRFSRDFTILLKLVPLRH